MITEEEVEREAIRLANIGRRTRLILLGTLNPQAQAAYRERAIRNLEDRK